VFLLARALRLRGDPVLTRPARSRFQVQSFTGDPRRWIPYRCGRLYSRSWAAHRLAARILRRIGAFYAPNLRVVELLEGEVVAVQAVEAVAE